MSRPIVAFAKGSMHFPAAKALVAEYAEIVEEDRAGEAFGLYVDSFSPPRIDASYLDRAPHLRAICSATVGYDNIDLDACTKRKIAVSNSRGSLTETVADLAYLHVIAAYRHVAESTAWARDGRWMSGPLPIADDLGGSTLGIVGLGAIGMAVARRARASGMSIVYHNRRARSDAGEVGARYLPFDELLREADCVVVLLPLNAQTRNMFGAAQFAAMKPTAYFVNVARGAVADTAALHAALAAKQIAGAAIDVTDPEPLPADHPLYALPNLFITPHIGSATRQTRERMSLYGARNLIAAIEGRPLPQIVNPAVYD